METKAAVQSKSWWGLVLVLPSIIQQVSEAMGWHFPLSNEQMVGQLEVVGTLLAALGWPLGMAGVLSRRTVIEGLLKAPKDKAYE